MTDFKLLQAYGHLGDLNREIIEYLYLNGSYSGNIAQFTKDLGKKYTNAATNVRKALGNLETMKIVKINRTINKIDSEGRSGANGTQAKEIILNNSWKQELVKRFEDNQILNNYMKYKPRNK